MDIDCICQYIASMHRLLASVASQNHCTDTVCFNEHPGYQAEQSGNEFGGPQLLLILLVWLLIAILLFGFRPRSLRSGDTGKPSSAVRDRSNNDDDPPLAH